MRASVWTALLWGLTSCAGPLVEAQVQPVRSEPLRHWRLFLDEVVTEAGHLDVESARRRQGDLAAFVAWLAVPRPARLTRSVGRHAFFLNAFDALVLHAAFHRWPEGGFPEDAWATLRFDRVVLDGHAIRLLDLEQGIIRTRLQDHRDVVALHRLRPTDPPWPRAPWLEMSIDEQLDGAMAGWLSDPARGVLVSEEGLRVPRSLADWSWDVRFQTGGDGMCTVVARYASGPLRLEAEAERARGCRWVAREDEAAISDGG